MENGAVLVFPEPVWVRVVLGDGDAVVVGPTEVEGLVGVGVPALDASWFVGAMGATVSPDPEDGPLWTFADFVVEQELANTARPAAAA